METCSKSDLEGKICSCGYAAAKAWVMDETGAPPSQEKYILVTKNSTPEMAPALYGSVGIITETGGLMSHLAVVSREVQIPCLSEVKNATEILKTGDMVRIEANGGLGKKGGIYLGEPK